MMLPPARVSPVTDARPCILLGAGGHARVLLALARAAGIPLRGVCDPALASQGIRAWQGTEVLGDDDILHTLPPEEVRLINGIGPVLQSRTRETIFKRLRDRGHDFPVLIHPRAWIADDVILGQGVQIMAGAIVQPGCHIGDNTVINTGSIIDHDCRIAAQVHIAPGAALCGGVTVSEGAFIGSGATVIQQIHVGAGSIVGAGTTLVRDLADNTRAISAVVRTNCLKGGNIL